jgi:NAD(P)-dependent dehydrogenase (short-subunit alcohol dehydrogenase family)
MIIPIISKDEEMGNTEFEGKVVLWLCFTMIIPIISKDEEMGNTEFEGKVVLVTGAAGNLGKAVVARFAAKGATMVFADYSEQGMAAIPEEGLTVQVDLTSEDSVQAMVESVVASCGRIDVLANIAGGFTMGPMLHETDARDWEFMMNLNARSVFYTSKAVVPHMLKQGGGSIISVSARAAEEGKGKMGPYCASKAAVITLTEI